jgi:protein-serine/threonine kinase
MLAGYLPFDDDPANPEGDNINLLYKYIVSTPLTFPEYVTPHARDLLRRILVPDPRKRADLFEVARHSWLSEYAQVVEFITSSTTTTGDISNTTVGAEDHAAGPQLGRSASVREPSKTQKSPTQATMGDLARKHGTVDQDAEDSHSKSQKDNKRRTVQVEYVAPRSQTVRGEDTAAVAAGPSSSRTRARSGSQGPVEVSPSVNRRAVSTEKPLPQDPPVSSQYRTQSRRPSSSQREQGMAPPSRPGREPPRAVSDNAYMQPLAGGASIARPNTGGSLTSTASGRGLPTRGSYGQPVAPTVADTNAHGRMSQPPPTNNKYNISSPLQQDDQDSDYGRPSVIQGPSKFERLAGYNDPIIEPKIQGHKRSNTVGGLSEKLFGRHASFFGGKTDKAQYQEKPKKSYPPVSMSGANIGSNNPRQSMDSSRRSISFGFGKKRSGSVAGSASSQEKQTRRFSLLPASFSLKAIGIGKDSPGPSTDDGYDSERADESRGYQAPPSRGNQDRYTSSAIDRGTDGASSDRDLDSPVQQGRRVPSNATQPQHQRFASQGQPYDVQAGSGRQQGPPRSYRPQEPVVSNQSESSLNYQSRNPPRSAPTSAPQNTGRYLTGFQDYDSEDQRQQSRSGRGPGVLQKNNRKFVDAYDQPEQGQGYSGTQGYGTSQQNGGSSGAARKVMDFFRRRGKAREGDDR